MICHNLDSVAFCKISGKMLPYWKLLGFSLYVILYFTVLDAFERWPESSTWTAFFKLLPMMHLLFIVISTETEDDKNLKPPDYRKCIFLGLVLSSLGDVALIWEEYFLIGVALFGVAQALYIRAFGFQPFGGGPTAASFGVVAVGTYVYTIDSMNEEAILKVAILLYVLLIFVMVWRATTQFQNEPNIENACACIGALLFIVSDFILVQDKWKGSFHLAPFWNMVLYYLAQLGITLSACNTLDWGQTTAKVKNS